MGLCRNAVRDYYPIYEDLIRLRTFLSHGQILHHDADELGDYVETSMAEDDYENVSEYFRHLVRQERARRLADRELRALIDDGLRSGVSDQTLENIWQDVKSRRPRSVADYRLTNAARDDLYDILDYTLATFGERQAGI